MAAAVLTIDAAPAELQAPYDGWLDAAVPLPEDVAFLPKRLRPPAAMRRVQRLSPLLLAAGLLVALGLAANGLERVPVALCALPMALALAAGGGLLFQGARRELGRHALRDNGGWRYGLFLGSDALLLRMDTGRCHLVPRSQVRAVTSDIAAHPNWPTRGTRISLIAARDDSQGVRLQFWARDLAHTGAAQRLATWAGVDLPA